MTTKHIKRSMYIAALTFVASAAVDDQGKAWKVAEDCQLSLLELSYV